MVQHIDEVEVEALPTDLPGTAFTVKNALSRLGIILAPSILIFLLFKRRKSPAFFATELDGYLSNCLYDRPALHHPRDSRVVFSKTNFSLARTGKIRSDPIHSLDHSTHQKCMGGCGYCHP